MTARLATVFVGAVEGSRAALAALCDAGLPPRLVVTLPANLSRRHSDFADLTPLATQYGIPIHYTARSEDAETLAAIAATAPDLVLVIGWSQLCGPEFRALPQIGCLGFHPSALPRLRGRGVIPWAILLGEAEAGASLFWLGEGADTGPIAAQARFPVDPDTVTARDLYDLQVSALCEMLPGLLRGIADGDVPSLPQDDATATVCARRRPEDGRIDWTAPAAAIHRLIRAVGPPYPGAFTHGPDGTRIIVTAVRHTPRDGYYIGIPGQVQAVADGLFTVACGDGRCLDILNWSGVATPPALHSKLGDPQR